MRVFAALKLEVGSSHKKCIRDGGLFFLGVDASMVTPGGCDLSNLQMTSFLLSVEERKYSARQDFPKKIIPVQIALFRPRSEFMQDSFPGKNPVLV